ncbi:MAG: patatin-like phospholipase family protein [Georgenia sp.]
MTWKFWERDRARDARVGLVLSGGGARVSFQLGALTYLYDRVGITPHVITGTSAGSILAGALAQSSEAAGQRRVLAELERLWRELRQSSDMFEELEWFATLREHGPGWVEAFTRQRQRQDTLGRKFARVANRSTHRLGIWAGGLDRSTPGSGVAEAAGVVVGGGTVEGGSAEEAAPAVRPGWWPFGHPGTEEPGAGWNPLSALELVAVLREAGRARPELETIVRGASSERSMYRPGPIIDRLLDPAVFVPERVSASGVTLRIAVVGLESGELRYVTETGGLVDRDNVPVPGAAPVPLVRAILASCSIPTVFAPVRLGEEFYVDGGVRETLPTEIAIEHLGVDTCYAVVASPPGVPREDGFADKDLLSIVVRTTAGIMSDEGLRDEVAYARAAGAVVIQPEIDVHDVLTVDPGLISISMDYGYLRAAEAHEGASTDEELLTREIILLRKRIWAAEVALLAPAGVAPGGLASGGLAPGGTRAAATARDTEPAGPQDPGRLAEIVHLKRRLRVLVDRAPAGRLPPGAGEWWRTWEGHPWAVAVRPDWA